MLLYYAKCRGLEICRYFLRNMVWTLSRPYWSTRKQLLIFISCQFVANEMQGSGFAYQFISIYPQICAHKSICFCLCYVMLCCLLILCDECDLSSVKGKLTAVQSYKTDPHRRLVQHRIPLHLSTTWKARRSPVRAPGHASASFWSRRRKILPMHRWISLGSKIPSLQ